MKRVKKAPLQTDAFSFPPSFIVHRDKTLKWVRTKWEAILAAPGGLEAAKKVGIETRGIGLPCRPGKVWHHLDIYDGPSASYSVVVDLETGKVIHTAAL